MRNLIGLPLLAGAVLLQSAIISRVQLLSGYADILLVILAAWALQEHVPSPWHWALVGGVFTAFISHMPWPVVFIGYFTVVYLARALSRRIWQVPIAAMFGVTLLGTLIFHFISFVTLGILGVPLPVAQVIGWITLPSLLLNTILAVPVYILVRDISFWVYPSRESE
jgi:cell shape-determining protein MreD